MDSSEESSSRTTTDSNERCTNEEVAPNRLIKAKRASFKFTF